MLTKGPKLGNASCLTGMHVILLVVSNHMTTNNFQCHSSQIFFEKLVSWHNGEAQVLVPWEKKEQASCNNSFGNMQTLQKIECPNFKQSGHRINK